MSTTSSVIYQCPHNVTPSIALKLAILAHEKGWNLIEMLRRATPKYSSLPRVQRIIVIPSKLMELKLNKVFKLSELCMIGCFIYEVLKSDEVKAKELLGEDYASIIELIERDPKAANKVLRGLI